MRFPSPGHGFAPGLLTTRNGLLIVRRIFTFVFLSAMLVACGGAQARHTRAGLAFIGSAQIGRHAVAIKLGKPTVFFGSDLRSSAASAAPVSLATQIASAPNGTVIHLAAGSYPQIKDYAARTGWVTISGQGDTTPPRIAGGMLWGAQFVRFLDIKFTSAVYINRTPYLNSTQTANNIAILNSEFDCGSTAASPVTMGIFLRGGSSNVTISGNFIHNCVDGFTSIPQDPLTTNVSITHNTFANITGDAIDLGGLQDVTISHNVVTNVSDPAGSFHNDGIQFFGNVHDVDITDNVLSNSRAQLIFIQDALAGRVSGVRSNTDILIAHNLIYGAGGVAIQDQGGINVRFIGNTMWDNYYASLWLRASPYSGIRPQNTVITDNIIQGFELLDSSQPASESDNLIDVGPAAYHYSAGGLALVGTTPTGYRFGGGDLINVNPRFVGEASGDFQARGRIARRRRRHRVVRNRREQHHERERQRCDG